LHETNELVHIKVDGQTITCSDTHPFYVPKKGWTEAIQLRAGDQLLLQSGKIVIIEMVQHEILEKSVKVYNFEVADWHTYFVSQSSILVHNACGDPVPGENHLFYGKGAEPGPDAVKLEDECITRKVNAFNEDGTDSEISQFSRKQYGRFKSNEWSWHKDVWSDDTIQKFWQHGNDCFTHYGPTD
jgi:hypothetical protein